jgi:hypothetical protein
LSVDGVQLSVADVWPMLLARRPVGTEGGVVSGHGDVDCVVVAVVDAFPTASTAATPTTYDVPQTRPVNEYDLPSADVDPTPDPSRNTRYATTATSLEGDQDSTNDVGVMPLVVRPVGGDGGGTTGTASAAPAGVGAVTVETSAGAVDEVTGAT